MRKQFEFQKQFYFKQFSLALVHSFNVKNQLIILCYVFTVPAYCASIRLEYLIPYISLIVRVFANGPRDLGSIPGRVIPKTQKMLLDAILLNTQDYKVRVKWSNPGKGVSPSPTPWCSSYRKGSFRVANFLLLYFIIAYTLLVLNRNTWNHTICANYLYQIWIIVCKQIITVKKYEIKKMKRNIKNIIIVTINHLQMNRISVFNDP